MYVHECAACPFFLLAMSLSWEALSEESKPVAVARETAKPTNYRIVYYTALDAVDPDRDAPHTGGGNGGGSSRNVQPASTYVSVPAGFGVRAEGGFGAAKLTLPFKWHFEPLPTVGEEGGPSKRDIYVVTGPSGSGKSFWVRMYVRNYLKLYPKNSVYLVSSLKSDDTLDEVGEIKRIDISKLVASPPSDVKTWTDSLVIVDDVEGLDAAKLAAVQRVQDMIASEGRHTNTTLIRASHLSTDYKRTRLLLQEAHGYVLFPQAGAHSQYSYLLSKYGGMEKKLVQGLLSSPSRWLLVHHTLPRYVLSPSSIYMMTA